ncbi:MAG: hypothetical protein ACK5SM_02940, partial [Sphingomonadales bacterium]
RCVYETVGAQFMAVWLARVERSVRLPPIHSSRDPQDYRKQQELWTLALATRCVLQPWSMQWRAPLNVHIAWPIGRTLQLNRQPLKC